MDSYDVVVVGGGISGLGLAHWAAASGRSTCLLEREGRLGGAMHSARHGEDFWLELGAHTCYNSYGRLLGLLERCGLLAALLPRARVPWRFLAEGRVQSVATRVHWLELALHLPRLLRLKRPGRTVADYYGRVLGPRNLAEVALPMLSAVLSQDAGPFPADLLFKPRPRRKEIRRSFTLPGGVEAIAEALGARGGFQARPGWDVTAVAEGPEGFTLTSAGGETCRAGVLALATPPKAAAALLPPGRARLAGLLGRIGEQRVATLGVVVEAEDTPLPPLAGLVAPGDAFYSVVARDPVPHARYRGFAFHFRADVPEAQRHKRAAEVLGVPRDRWARAVGKTNVLPRLALGHADLVAAIDRELAGGRLLLTGNYFAGPALEDCLARSAAEAERLRGMA